MPKIMVLNDDQRWSDYTGCNIITLDDEAYEKLMNDGKFSCDIPIKDQQQLSELDTDWEDVAHMFYNACGGRDNNPPASGVWLEELIRHWSGHFHIEEDDDE